MGTGRRVVTILALTAFAAGAAPAGAGAQGLALPGCHYPKAWDVAPTELQYEAYLFSGQTQFDLQRVTADTLVPFTAVTIKRAQKMTQAMTNTLVGVVTAGVNDPPGCGS